MAEARSGTRREGARTRVRAAAADAIHLRPPAPVGAHAVGAAPGASPVAGGDFGSLRRTQHSRARASASLPPMAVADSERAAPWRTHTVFNQPPPLEGVDVFSSNVPLVEGVEREGAGWVRERAAELGRLIGGEPQQSWGRLANENRPVLRTHDRYGNRIDEVEFHPAWHKLMKMGVEHELHSLPWTSTRPCAHAARAGLYMTAMQAEAGFCCPITMTFAVVPALRAQPELAAHWEPPVTANSYDPRLIAASAKS